MENKPGFKKSNQWLQLINIPIQMGVIVFMSYKLGFWLDENYPNNKIYYYKVCTMVGVFLALYNVHRQVTEINKSE
jgi:Putative F0F1-ATPase subunit Ca2+/Mg2+ transporter